MAAKMAAKKVESYSSTVSITYFLTPYTWANRKKWRDLFTLFETHLWCS